jgi:hypothetical protein
MRSKNKNIRSWISLICTVNLIFLCESNLESLKDGYVIYIRKLTNTDQQKIYMEKIMTSSI